MLVNKEQSYAIVGAAMEVYKTLREVFTEYVYQDALEVELRSRGIPYEREKQPQQATLPRSSRMPCS